jgi:hypothetical protein
MATEARRENASALRRRALETKQLMLSSLSSVLGGVVGAALGGGGAMTLVGMAVAPWLTAFVEYPGPYRHRRVTLVLLVAATVSAIRALRHFDGVGHALDDCGRRGSRRRRHSRAPGLGALPA